MPDSLLPDSTRQTSDGVFSLSAPITVGNTNVESVVVSYSIPANSLAVGTTYDIVASGFGGSTAQNLTIRMRYGGLGGVILHSIVVAAAATTSPQGFWYRGSFTCRSTGATGTAFSQGYFLNEISTTMPNPVKLSENNAAAPVIDTTTQRDLVLTMQWTTTAAGATLTTTNAYTQLVKA